jgi:probable HAF family extracellular repeat protein
LPGGEPGTQFSVATGINNAGQAVGFSDGKAVEWNAGRINDLGALPGFTASFAQNINNTGQVVGYSDGPLQGSVIAQATKWSNGSVINLGGLPWLHG